MNYQLKKEGKFTFSDTGEGTPIIILHGLMGGLSNFDGVTNFFSEKEYRVLIPELPIYKTVSYTHLTLPTNREV